MRGAKRPRQKKKNESISSKKQVCQVRSKGIKSRLCQVKKRTSLYCLRNKLVTSGHMRRRATSRYHVNKRKTSRYSLRKGKQVGCVQLKEKGHIDIVRAGRSMAEISNVKNISGYRQSSGKSKVMTFNNATATNQKIDIVVERENGKKGKSMKSSEGNSKRK